MILYNSSFKLVGISKELLTLFGFTSFGGFMAKHSDVSDFFSNDNIKQEDGKNYLKELIDAKKYKADITINLPRKSVESSLFINEFYMDDEVMYEVDIVAISSSDKEESAILENKRKQKDRTLSNNYKISNIFDHEYKKELAYIEKQRVTSEQTMDESGIIDSSWIEKTATNLGLSIDDFYSFLNTFITSAKEKEEELFESLLSGNKEVSSSILSQMKEPAGVLDLQPIIKQIYYLENSNPDEIRENFRKYQNLITNMEEIITKRKAIWTLVYQTP